MTGLRWSRRTTTTIAEELAKLGIAVSPNTVARLVPYSFGLRKILIRAKPLPAVKIPGFLKKPHAIPIGITQRVVQ
jgi:hypothetical protein